MGYKSPLACGQSNNDTFMMESINHGAAWEVYGPIGGCIFINATTVGNTSGAFPWTTYPGSAPWSMSNGSTYNGSAYTLTNMMLRVTGSGAEAPPSNDIDIFVNINGTDQQSNLQIVIPAGISVGTPPTGWFYGLIMEDHSHIDVVPGFAISSPNTPRVALGAKSAGGTGGLCVTAVFFEADFPDRVSVPWAAAPDTSQTVAHMPQIATKAQRWYSPMGGWHEATALGGSAPMAHSLTVIPCAGTWSGLQVNLCSSSGGVAGQVRNLQPVLTWNYLTALPGGTMGTPGSGNLTTGKYGNQILSWPDNQVVGGTPVQVVDNSHVDVLMPGLLVMMEANNPGAGANSIQNWGGGFGSTFTSAKPNQTPMIVSGGTSPLGTGQFWQQMGQTCVARCSQNTAETMSLATTAGTFSGLYFMLDANTLSVPGAFQFYINIPTDNASSTTPTTRGTPWGNQAGAIPAGVSGQQVMIADTSHVDFVPKYWAYALSFFGMNTTTTLLTAAVSFNTPAPNLMSRGVG